MDRQEYLDKFWTSYPPMPADADACGRLIAIEKSNEYLHLTLIKNNQKISLQVSDKQELANVIRVGDIIAVSAKKQITLLAPAKADLPERHLNLSQQNLWNLYLVKVREFFNRQGFTEIQTPSLVSCPGTEPTLDVFSTELQVGSRKQKMYLPTSPELHLKKTIALGAEKIFEIAKCFRNGEVTSHHQPEFTMIEWYRAYDDLDTIRGDVIGLINFLFDELSQVVREQNLLRPTQILRKSVAELFAQYCDFKLTPQTTLHELKTLCEKFGVDAHSAESIDDYFFLLFLEKIEVKLNADELLFVEKYPPYQAALARLTAEGWGDRFEVYWQGLELANAFHELNDPKIQRERFAQDLEKKKQLGKEMIPLDQEFLQCLDAGMPPSAGIALGLERLFMAIFGVIQIGTTKTFPYL